MPCYIMPASRIQIAFEAPSRRPKSGRNRKPPHPDQPAAFRDRNRPELFLRSGRMTVTQQLLHFLCRRRVRRPETIARPPVADQNFLRHARQIQQLTALILRNATRIHHPSFYSSTQFRNLHRARHR